ncbi:MAG TPA: helix-turn-helix domain-containing protein [Candidatus Woesebacteria bacterium]|nr:helix-turn-helix domain-containing protein [Candidatus Woesebacteria bacterium]
MANQTCTTESVGVTLRVIGGKWKPLILWHLSENPIRFGELMRKMPGITQKMLTQQLRELEDDGLVIRKLYPEVPPRVEYSLSDYGKTLGPVLQAMSDWGRKHVVIQSEHRKATPISTKPEFYRMIHENVGA